MGTAETNQYNTIKTKTTPYWIDTLLHTGGTSVAIRTNMTGCTFPGISRLLGKHKNPIYTNSSYVAIVAYIPRTSQVHDILSVLYTCYTG